MQRRYVKVLLFRWLNLLLSSCPRENISLQARRFKVFGNAEDENLWLVAFSSKFFHLSGNALRKLRGPKYPIQVSCIINSKLRIASPVLMQQTSKQKTMQTKFYVIMSQDVLVENPPQVELDYLT